MSQTCSVWGDGFQLDRQGEVGVFVVVQGMAVSTAAVKEPLPTEHRPVGQVQPQVLPHLTLLTLPTTGGQRDDQKKHQAVQNYLFMVVWLTSSSPCQLTLH